MPSWIGFFIVLTTLAIIIQAIILIALFVQLRRTAARAEQVVSDVRTQLIPILSRVQLLVGDVAPRLTSIVSDASEITRLARSQTQRVDRILAETVERLRLQMVHVDQILTGALETVEEAGAQLRRSVVGPVTKTAALIRGIQTGLEFYRAARHGGHHKNRESHAEQPQDEGMFI
jgi:type IV secretory pathway VirB2 component (pilin)